MYVGYNRVKVQREVCVCVCVHATVALHLLLSIRLGRIRENKRDGLILHFLMRKKPLTRSEKNEEMRHNKMAITTQQRANRI